MVQNARSQESLSHKHLRFTEKGKNAVFVAEKERKGEREKEGRKEGKERRKKEGKRKNLIVTAHHVM